MASEKPPFNGTKGAGLEGDTDRIDFKDERSSGSTSPNHLHEATLWERQRDPYLGKSERDIVVDLEGLIQRYDLHDLGGELTRGARYAYNRDDTERLDPTEEERHWIAKEKSPAFKDKWSQTKMMYYVAGRSLYGKSSSRLKANHSKCFAALLRSFKAWTKLQSTELNFSTSRTLASPTPGSRA